MNYHTKCTTPFATHYDAPVPDKGSFAQKIVFAQKILILHKNSKITGEEII